MFDFSIVPSFTGSGGCWAAVGVLIVLAFTLIMLGNRVQLLPVTMAGALTAGSAVFWMASPAFAQSAAELGATARDLVDQAEARGRSMQQALQDWSAEVQQRGQAYQEEARALAETNHANLQRGMTMLKGDTDFGQAADMMLAEQDPEGALYIAVSLTMPKEALQQLAADGKKAGAKLVIRGLVNGSFEQTLIAAKEVFGQDAVSGVAIEPQVFRAYGVDRVPAFIAARSPVQPCDEGVDCDSAATPHDRLAGNISLAEALRLLAQGGDQAPDVARAALARLEG